MSLAEDPPLPEGMMMEALRRRLRRDLGDEVRPELLPEPGAEVDGFRLEEQVGQGGFGTVYRATRGSETFALKFIYLPESERWALRETEVLMRLPRGGGMALEGLGYWPRPHPLFAYIVLKYVPGPTLEDHARRHPLSALQVAHLVRALALELASAHAHGVVHRDVKEDNVRMDAQGQPVLVDWGLGSYEGAPRATGPNPPGTGPYRSPEAVRFPREAPLGERYPLRPSDDQWALGVVLYRLLTGRYPFEEEPLRRRPTLEELILQHMPPAPHVLNPRVPVALSKVCERMLAKPLEDRYPNVKDVATALEAALSQADETWQAALREVRSEDKPSAGQPVEKAEAPPQASRWKKWRQRLAGAAGLSACLGLVLTALLLARRPAPELAPHQELASESRSQQGAPGAAPQPAPTPAPVAETTPPKGDTPVSKATPPPTPLSEPPEPRPRSKPLPVANAARSACVLLAATSQLACPPAGLQARPDAAPCPHRAVETMRELGINVGDQIAVDLRGEGGMEITLRPVEEEFSTAPLRKRWGKLPPPTVFTGRLYISKTRVYARFTRAVLPDGTEYRMCLQLHDQFSEALGAEREPGGGEEVRLWSVHYARAVEYFD